jgi:hypothetical protein
MKNVTLTLDEETHRAARIAAAEKGISLSALVRQQLIELVGNKHSHQSSLKRAFSAMDRVSKFSASNRASRAEVHER